MISAGGQEKRYLLHRLILAQCSGFFDAGTSEEWSRVQAQSQVSRNGVDDERRLTRIGEEDEGASRVSDARRVDPRDMKGAPKMRWRYELDWENKEEDEEPMLVQKVCYALLYTMG